MLNQYELTLLAAARARQLAKGADPLVPVEKGNEELYLTIALREIEGGFITKETQNPLQSN